MFESVERTMSKNKGIVIAAIAVAGILVFAIPPQQPAVATDGFEEEINDDTDQSFAQSLVDRTNQDIDQNARQDQDQNQEQDQDASNDADQSNTADVSQDEKNNQVNVIDTGDNDAKTTQSGENEANENGLTSDSSTSGGDASSWAKKWSKADSSGGDAGDATSTSAIGQSVSNDANTEQDSSADNNDLTNKNEFGDDVAIVDQDNTANQRATNVGIQDQDARQDLDQDADNFNFEVDTQYGTSQQADDFSANLRDLDVDLD